jgi:hypothetical protein
MKSAHGLSFSYLVKLMLPFMFAIAALSSQAICADASTELVPLTIATGVPVLRVFVNGKGPFSFVLDTGSADTIIAPSLAHRLELLANGIISKSGSGSGAALVAAKTKISKIAIGNFTRYNVPTLELPLPKALRNCIRGSEVEGIIGCELFRDSVVTLDYENETMTIASLTTPTRYDTLEIPMRMSQAVVHQE